jgi:hypothetical protein
MAKELPFFKFEPSEWDNGIIQMCSFEAQGIFINICSMYWQRLGDLPYQLAVQKVCGGNATALRPLCDHKIIDVIDDKIHIDFLNEQLLEFKSIRNKNSENAQKGWEKRKNDATAMRPHSDRNAIREEKRREDKIVSIMGDASEKYFIIIKPKYAGEKAYRLNGLQAVTDYIESQGGGWPNTTFTSKWLRQFSGDEFEGRAHIIRSYNKFTDKEMAK